LNEIKIQGFQRKVGTHVLQVSGHLKLQDRIALLGANGSGKTSFLRWIAGLDQGQGQIFFGEREVSLWKPADRQIGMVFQEIVLFPTLNVMHNCVYGLKIRAISQTQWLKELKPWVEAFGLEKKLSLFPHELSGGEQQRVAIIRACIWKPQLLLLDEAFHAMDVDWKQKVWDYLIEFQRNWPLPILFVTHRDEEVSCFATGKWTILPD